MLIWNTPAAELQRFRLVGHRRSASLPKAGEGRFRSATDGRLVLMELTTDGLHDALLPMVVHAAELPCCRSIRVFQQNGFVGVATELLAHTINNNYHRHANLNLLLIVGSKRGWIELLPDNRLNIIIINQRLSGESLGGG